MKLNMSPIRKIVEDLMIDECQVYAETKSDVDGTGQVTITQTIHYEGKCVVGITNFEGDSDNQYLCFLPVDALEPALRDIVLVTASQNDERLVGKEFEVAGIMEGTYSAYRGLTLMERRAVGA